MRPWLAIAMLAGCSNDPGYICNQHRVRIPYDGTCAFDPVPITIDGDFRDWQPLLLYAPDCGDCKPGEVAGVYATETPDGEVAMYAQTIGAPITDDTHSYLV